VFTSEETDTEALSSILLFVESVIFPSGGIRSSHWALTSA
jgi:hypothetical protein